MGDGGVPPKVSLVIWYRTGFRRCSAGQIHPFLAGIVLAFLVCLVFGGLWFMLELGGDQGLATSIGRGGNEDAREFRDDLAGRIGRDTDRASLMEKRPVPVVAGNQPPPSHVVRGMNDNWPLPAVPPIDLFDIMEISETSDLSETPAARANGGLFLHWEAPDQIHPHGEMILLPGSGEFGILLRVILSGRSRPPDSGRIGEVVLSASSGRIRHEILDEHSIRLVYDPVPYSTLVDLDVRIKWLDGEDSMTIGDSVHLMTPMSTALMIDGIIDGYEVGRYPDPLDPEVRRKFKVRSKWPELYPDRYHHPHYLYRVDSRSKGLTISPHIDLGFFAIDYPWESLGLPQYVAIDHHLVRKLEEVIFLMKKDGYEVPGLTPIYGFRPPVFNLGTIKSKPDTNLKEPFSMHQYGRAVDFIIDATGNGVMDDLNHDGVSDIYDAAVIMHYVNILDRDYRKSGFLEMVGGAGIYSGHDFVERLEYYPQTPYIHVDTRGFLRPDGTLIRWDGDGTGQWPNGETIRWGDI